MQTDGARRRSVLTARKAIYTPHLCRSTGGVCRQVLQDSGRRCREVNDRLCGQFPERDNRRSPVRGGSGNDPTPVRRHLHPGASIPCDSAFGRSRSRSAPVSDRKPRREPIAFLPARGETPTPLLQQTPPQQLPDPHRHARPVALEDRYQRRACFCRMCFLMPSFTLADAFRLGLPSGNSAARTSAEVCRPALRTIISSFFSSHSRMDPGPTPSFLRISAGTEIWPWAVSLDWASGMVRTLPG